MGEGTTQPRPAVVAAREALLASRASLDDELVRLEASARAAVDIPAKIKRHPAKAAGIAAGAGFIVVGGPKRLFRRARSAVFGPPEPMPTSMLPKEIDKALGKLGSDGDQVRGTIEREFAAFLEQTAPSRRRQNLTADLRAVMTTGARAFMFRAGRDLAGRLVSTDPALYREELERIRSRRASQGGDKTP